MDHSDTLTVSSAWMEFLLDSAKEKGCDLSQDFQSVFHADRRALQDETKRFPLDDETKLFQKALKECGDLYFGLHMGERVRPSYAGILGYATMSSSQLQDAVDLLVKYEHYYTEVAICHLEVNEQEDFFCIIWESCLENLPQRRHRVESAFASWVSFGRWITGTNHNPIKVEFSHSAPEENLAEYQRIFGCPVLFDQPRDAITLEGDFLELPILDANPEVNKVMMERVKTLVTAFEARGDLLKEVKVTIREKLDHGPVNLDMVAEHLNIKPWTLRRKLRALDCDFSTLMDEVRKNMATDMLYNPSCQISEIAGRLGYSEQSAFNRAFKRWFQSTPLEYRQRLLKERNENS